jgi:hypothetical protein
LKQREVVLKQTPALQLVEAFLMCFSAMLELFPRDQEYADDDQDDGADFARGETVDVL